MQKLVSGSDSSPGSRSHVGFQDIFLASFTRLMGIHGRLPPGFPEEDFGFRPPLLGEPWQFLRVAHF